MNINIDLVVNRDLANTINAIMENNQHNDIELQIKEYLELDKKYSEIRKKLDDEKEKLDLALEVFIQENDLVYKNKYSFKYTYLNRRERKEKLINTINTNDVSLLQIRTKKIQKRMNKIGQSISDKVFNRLNYKLGNHISGKFCDFLELYLLMKLGISIND